MKKMLAILMTLALLCSTALAEEVVMNGTVISTQTVTITSEIGGTVDAVYASAGEHIHADDVLATVSPTKVYAKEDGKAYLFGTAGDDAETIASRYGAVVYIEPDYTYTISGDTKTAYDAEENRIIHPGEKVYLSAYNDGNRTGEGIVTQVSGSSFTVEVKSGSFNSNETISIFRTQIQNSNRIGRGTLSRVEPIAYTASGTILRFHVKNGAAVKKGDVLFETLDCTPGQTTQGIKSGISGVITAVNAESGSSLSNGGSVATLYPDDAMRIEATVNESDLQNIQLGQAVTVELTYAGSGAASLSGIIESISLVGESAGDGEEATFKVIIQLTDAACTG